MTRYSPGLTHIAATTDRLLRSGDMANGASQSQNPNEPIETSRNTANDTNSESDARRIAAIVVRVMTKRFGYRWTRQFGTTPDNQTVKDLSGLTAEQLRRGLDAVRESGEQWPPSIPEFLAMCRLPVPGEDSYRIPISRALPEPESVIAARRARAREFRRQIGLPVVDFATGQEA